MDFVALIRYPGPAAVMEAIHRLEHGPEPDEFASVALHGRDMGLAFPGTFPHGWVPNRESTTQDRPLLPCLTVSLNFPAGFSLTFGRDMVRAYHLLRWRFFLTDPDWQRLMLSAVQWLCERLGALDCVLTSDFHPAGGAFFGGRTFEQALAAGGPEDGEVASLADLYRQWVPEDEQGWAYCPGPEGKTRRVCWPADSPLPEGWYRGTTWDSAGYWRFAWRSAHRW